MRKRDHPVFANLVADEGLAFLAGCGGAAGMFSALFAVDPLEEDIEQKVTAQNAKRQENRKRHADLTRTGVHSSPNEKRVEAEALKSPEKFMKILLGGFAENRPGLG
jgi:hypothetical protein